jgi:hypothetical protein
LKNLILFSFLLLVALASCVKQDVSYVESIASSGNPAITQSDTFSGNFIISRPDSFVTNNTASFFIGHYNDAVFGKVNCEDYLQFLLPTAGPETANNPVYDSMALILHLDSDYYGDTMTTMNINAYRVTENMRTANLYIYNTTSFATEAAPLGTAQVQLHPLSGDSISIKINNSFGNQLYNFFATNAPQVTDSNAFYEYLKGIKLTTTGSTNVVYSFANTAFTLRMYYHTDVGQIVKHFVDFTAGRSNYESYNVKAVRTGTVLASLDTFIEINAARLGNKFFCQNLTGVRTGFNFPAIKELPKQATFVKLLNAQLEIKPAGPSGAGLPYPSEMPLYFRGIDGSLIGPLSDASGNTQTGSLSVDYLYGVNTKYLYDITSYISSELTANTYTAYQVVPVPSSNLNRLICGTTSNAQYRTRLIISALTYQK